MSHFWRAVYTCYSSQNPWFQSVIQVLVTFWWERMNIIWLSVGISMRQLLLATSVSISRHAPLLLVGQSRECQLLILPLKFKTAISRMQGVLGRHFRHLVRASHPARLLKTRQLPKNRIVNVRTESMSHNLRLIPTNIIVTDYARWIVCSRATGLAIGWATMRMVMRFVEQFHDWYDQLRSLTTGCVTVKLVVQAMVICWWFIKAVSFWADLIVWSKLFWNRYRCKDSCWSACNRVTVRWTMTFLLHVTLPKIKGTIIILN